MSARLARPIGSDDHTQGPPDAPLQLVEYGDFECPYCGMAYPIVKGVQRHFGQRLQFVFRNFPLSQAHPHAEHAAEAAEAAGTQGKFWPMHDMLYENQQALDDAHLVAYAESLGVDPELVATALRTQTYAARVQSNFIGGVRSGVNGTPTFFINGVRHDGSWELAPLVAALEAALQAPAVPGAAR